MDVFGLIETWLSAGNKEVFDIESFDFILGRIGVGSGLWGGLR